MEPGEKSPDAKTIWLFKEKPGGGGMREMFGMAGRLLEKNGITARVGSIADASFVDAPKQRNTREENKTIKNGGMPEEWLLPRNAAKTEQKDTDARRAKKGPEAHFGYKDRVNVDRESKTITEFSVAPANGRGSVETVGPAGGNDREPRADGAHAGEELHKEINKKIQKSYCK